MAAGRSALAPASGDRRFADAAWNDSAAFRRLLQAYVALAGGLDRCVDEAKLDPAATDRARFVVSLIVDAHRADQLHRHQSGGAEQARRHQGGERHPRPCQFRRGPDGGTFLPKQVDARPFKVGRNLAASPRRGGVPQRGAGADPVRADHAGCPPAPAADRPAADQQVLRLRSRAGQEHRAMVARQRRADLRRELAQPDARACRLGHRRLRRGARGGGRRDARDHRVAGRQRLGRVLGRHHAHRIPRVSCRAAQPQDPCGHARGVRARHVGGAADRPPGCS